MASSRIKEKIKQLTDRDIEIVRRVHAHRLLRSKDHILRIFDGKERALRRARRLADNGYLFRLPGRGTNEQDIFALGNKGADLLARRFGYKRQKVDWALQNRRLGAPYVAHTLLVADILVGIEAACREREGVRFIPEDEIAAGQGGTVCKNPLEVSARVRWDGETKMATIYADGLFGIEALTPEGEGKRSYYFLEADRGTMPVVSSRLDRPSIIKKMLVYQAAAKVDRAIRGKSAHERKLGIRSLRTLFVAAPDSARGSDGKTRVESFEAASRQITKGQGSRLFLFAGLKFARSADPLIRTLVLGRDDGLT